MQQTKYNIFIFLAVFGLFLLPAVADAIEVKTGSYTGNGTDDRSITGVGFQPDFVLIDREGFGSAAEAVIRTSSMSGDNAKKLNSTSTLLANLVQSLDSDGFEVGDDISVNGSSATYHWVAIKVGQTDSAVGTYTGNGNDDREITGLGFDPTVVFVMSAADDYANFRTSAHASNGSGRFIAESGPQSNTIQDFVTDGFEVGTDAEANENSTAYHYFAFKASTVAAVGTYTGNGVDDREITGVGFDPDAVVVHRASGFRSVQWMSDTISGSSSLPFVDSSGDDANNIQGLLTDAFEVGTDADVNGNTLPYGWFAFVNGTSAVAVTGGSPGGGVRTTTVNISNVQTASTTPSSTIISYETSSPTDTRVNWSTAIGQLYTNSSLYEATLQSKHKVALFNLAPETTYYYAVGGGIPGKGNVSAGPFMFTTLKEEIIASSSSIEENMTEEEKVLTQQVKSLQSELITLLQQFVQLLQAKLPL